MYYEFSVWQQKYWHLSTKEKNCYITVFGDLTYSVTSDGCGWRKGVVNRCLEFAL